MNRNNIEESEKCACGGTIYTGHMYGDRFVAGTVDLRLAFRGKENLMADIFPDGIPERGKPAKICSKCFTIMSV